MNEWMNEWMNRNVYTCNSDTKTNARTRFTRLGFEPEVPIAHKYNHKSVNILLDHGEWMFFLSLCDLLPWLVTLTFCYQVIFVITTKISFFMQLNVNGLCKTMTDMFYTIHKIICFVVILIGYKLCINVSVPPLGLSFADRDKHI